MQAISTSEELKIAIRLIQVKQATEGRLLKEQFLLTCESQMPGNPIRSTIKDVISTPKLINIIAVTVTGLANGYLSKFLVAGSAVNVLRNILTGILQSGITRIILKRTRNI